MHFESCYPIVLGFTLSLKSSLAPEAVLSSAVSTTVTQDFEAKVPQFQAGAKCRGSNGALAP